jgi:hypothetical protein
MGIVLLSFQEAVQKQRSSTPPICNFLLRQKKKLVGDGAAGENLPVVDVQGDSLAAREDVAEMICYLGRRT